MEKIEERMNRLETAFEEFTRIVGLEFNKVYNLFMLSHIENERISNDVNKLKEQVASVSGQLKSFIEESMEWRKEDREKFNTFVDEMHVFKNEMKDFKDEMKDFKDEMKDFKDEMMTFKLKVDKFVDGVMIFQSEMKDFKDKMKEFKDEMKEFKREVQAFIEEMKHDRRRMNKQWGELSNKMGTVVEDIIYPTTRPVLEKYFNCELITTMMNITRKKAGKREEFDVIAVSKDTVFLIEVKTTMRKQYVDDFKKNKLARLRFFFEEYSDKKLVPILASLRYDDTMLRYVTKQKIYAMAFREWDYMDIVNFDEVTV